MYASTDAVQTLSTPVPPLLDASLRDYVTERRVLDDILPETQRCVLRVVHSSDPRFEDSSFELTRRTLVFGRGVEGPGCIHDAYLSREHVHVRRGRGGQWVLEDLDSRNGTYLDGERVTGPRVLASGSVVSLGSTVMVVDEEIDPELLPVDSEADPALAREIVGESFATRRLRASVATVAPTEDPVLILGPSGSGKEVTAGAIHRLSGREGPFVPVNCAAIPHDLAEAELFGHRKGAFTGADADRQGVFEQASGGTLFLDEIGELSLSLQAKLLRVIEEGAVRPVGSTQPIEVDVRIVAATNADLSGPGFRDDLLARLEDWVLHLSPLRDRRADIIPLWEHFVRPEARDCERSERFSEALLLYDWPLNARELRKVARRISQLGRRESEWGLDLLPRAMRTSVPPSHSEPAKSVPERSQLEEALRNASGNVSQVATAMGCARKQVYRWMERFGLDPRSYRSAGVTGPDQGRDDVTEEIPLTRK
jgi:transcriptional regulator with AAA-type ATPase domain